MTIVRRKGRYFRAVTVVDPGLDTALVFLNKMARCRPDTASGFIVASTPPPPRCARRLSAVVCANHHFSSISLCGVFTSLKGVRGDGKLTGVTSLPRLVPLSLPPPLRSCHGFSRLIFPGGSVVCVVVFGARQIQFWIRNAPIFSGILVS